MVALEQAQQWPESARVAVLVCSVQKWDTVNADGSTNPPFMMCQTNYLEKRGGQWKALHMRHACPFPHIAPFVGEQAPILTSKRE